ncbi:hypothetical protein [Streptomyces europaeiscabiei]|uniref:hypothetical protein n=1 Tax=Streptomyces europaeiscabiei TaxID=146819 RepID=UPI002E180F36
MAIGKENDKEGMANVASNAHDALIELLREPARANGAEGHPPTTSEWATYMDSIAARAEADTDDDSDIYMYDEDAADDEDDPAPAAHPRAGGSHRIAVLVGGLFFTALAITGILVTEISSSGMVVSTAGAGFVAVLAAALVMWARLTGHRRRARDGSTHHRTWLLQR